ncbi:MAG: glycosyltransferase, partial [Syntrophobacteraceae bacterium]
MTATVACEAGGMIPKLIHQTAKTHELPSEWRRFQQIVRELHPAWEYRLWTDEDNDAFVKKEYLNFLPVFRAFSKGIMRADVIRYLIMYRIGGLYLDLDYEMLKPFDLLAH